MTESDNVTDNLVFAVNSLITLYQIRHFYLLAKWRPRCARRHARPTDLNYWIKHPFEFSDPILKPEYL